MNEHYINLLQWFFGWAVFGVVFLCMSVNYYRNRGVVPAPWMIVTIFLISGPIGWVLLLIRVFNKIYPEQ